MFERYDPRRGQRLGLLTPEGELREADPQLPILSDAELLRAFRLMSLARVADEWAISLNRQGRMPTYPPNAGQEANGVGALMALRREDWLVPAFRELGALLARGIPLSQLYLYWYGNEMGSHLPLKSFHTLPIAIPVGSQPAHAVGLAYAEKLSRSGRVVLSFMGEGAISEGAVHEAFNLAAVWQVGVIFYVQNNGWAISLPSHRQTASATVAEKAFAYGFEGVQVDGNDLMAVYAAVSLAARLAREQGRPVMIEGCTYRLGAHTTSDDPSLYREESEVRQWEARDPLKRVETYLRRRGLLDDGRLRALQKECRQEAREAFREVERHQDPGLEDTFRHMYRQLPAVLLRQMERRRSGVSLEPPAESAASAGGPALSPARTGGRR